MSLNENKPTYGTVEAAGATKDSRRGVVVGLVRPRARKSIHGAFMSTESSHRARRHRRDVFASQAAAACFTLGFAVASVGPSATQGLRGTALYHRHACHTCRLQLLPGLRCLPGRVSKLGELGCQSDLLQRREQRRLHQ